MVLWWLAISKRYQVSKKLFCLSRWVVFQMFSLRHFLLLLPQSWLRMVGKYNGSTNTYFYFFKSFGLWPLDFTRKIKRHARKLFFISLTSASADISLRARMLRAIFLVKFRWVNQNNFILLFTYVRSERTKQFSSLWSDEE